MELPAQKDMAFARTTLFPSDAVKDVTLLDEVAEIFCTAFAVKQVLWYSTHTNPNVFPPLVPGAVGTDAVTVVPERDSVPKVVSTRKEAVVVSIPK